MSIRSKTALIIFFGLAGVLTGLFLVSRTVILSGFARVEHNAAEQNVMRLVEVLNNQAGNMNEKVEDWAHYDETYAFMNGDNPEYIDSNITRQSLNTLKINLIVFINQDGSVKYSKLFDLNKLDWLQTPPTLRSDISVVWVGRKVVAQRQASSGIAYLHGKPMMLSAAPILTSEMTGKPRGALLFGRFIDSDMIARFSRSIQGDVDIEQIENSLIMREIVQSRGKLRLGSVFVHPIDNSRIAGYTLLTDIWGNPALVMKVISQRSIMTQGKSSLQYLLTYVMIMGLMSGTLTFLFMEKAVISRLRKLRNEVVGIGMTADHRKRVEVEGADELGELAESVNITLNALADSQAEIRENENRLKRVLDSVQIGVAIIDPANHKIVDVNETGARMIGKTKNEIIGNTCHHFICPANVGNCPITDLRQDVDNSERVLLRPDCAKVPILKTVVSVLIDGWPRLVESFVDISERKEAERALRDAHDKLEMRVQERMAELAQANAALMNEIVERKRIESEIRHANLENERLLMSISSALVVCDSNGIISKWNKAAEEIFGISASHVLGKCGFDNEINWEDREAEERLNNAVRSGEAANIGHMSFVRPDGRRTILMVTVTPIPSDDGKSWECLIAGSDVTEQRVLEMQLQHSQKLESIGQLAAGIAHEINTPIQYVGDNTRFVKDSFTQVLELLKDQAEALQQAKDSSIDSATLQRIQDKAAAADIEYLMEEIPQAAEQTLEGVDRVAKIVRAMKEFSHPGGEDMSEEDLNRAIESTITVSRNEWKYVAELKTEFDPELPLVPCLIGDLNQVVLNLIVNAAHAIASKREQSGDKEKGTITVGTRMLEDWAEIFVRDTGTGIPNRIQQKIFEPFFTTKDVGKGTGQGLAMARSIVVNKHGGAITVDSVEGEGTTFHIRIPMLRKAA